MAWRTAIGRLFASTLLDRFQRRLARLTRPAVRACPRRPREPSSSRTSSVTLSVMPCSVKHGTHFHRGRALLVALANLVWRRVSHTSAHALTGCMFVVVFSDIHGSMCIVRQQWSHSSKCLTVSAQCATKFKIDGVRCCEELGCSIRAGGLRGPRCTLQLCGHAAPRDFK
ncbi:hypothetical protein BC830DRAFT_312336 [Chytriomyces sp. MP71]|nr:hypothetical protein BC830DRAFT_312336 [Chytriomyces sp. MP71]